MKEKLEAIAVLEKEITPLVKQAEAIVVIKSQEQQNAAGALLTELNRYADSVKEARERLTKPLNVAIKAARTMFKPLETRVEERITVLRKAMGAYQLEADTIAQKERDGIASKVGEGRGKLSPEKAVIRMSEVDAPSERIETESGGTVRFNDVKNFEIVSYTKLYHNEKFMSDVFVAAQQKDIVSQLVRRYLKQGEELEGVRYFMEKVPVNNR